MNSPVLEITASLQLDIAEPHCKQQIGGTVRYK